MHRAWPDQHRVLQTTSINPAESATCYSSLLPTNAAGDPVTLGTPFLRIYYSEYSVNATGANVTSATVSLARAIPNAGSGAAPAPAPAQEPTQAPPSPEAPPSPPVGAPEGPVIVPPFPSIVKPEGTAPAASEVQVNVHKEVRIG